MSTVHSCHHEKKHCYRQSKTERFLQPTLLLCLSKKPSYGYELIEQLKAFPFYSNGPDIGAVYRHLRRLEQEGLVGSHWEPGEAGPAKRIYSITQEGIKLLHNWAQEIKERRDALDYFLEQYQDNFKVHKS
jgi:PadR family transcriptional regulator, regulatory protein PadR